MGISNSMYTGISGLSANSDAMSVVSNNIANANTRGFKSDRAEFEDLLAVSLNENSLIGRGSRLRATTTQHTQGALTNTGGITDLGIQGDGFFIVRNESTESRETNGKLFTRQGSFRFDRDGYLSDVNGSKIQGYMADDDGSLSTKLTDLQVVSNSVPPSATSVMNLDVNLDSRSRGIKEDFDPMRPKETSNFASTVTVYDSFGTGHNTSVYFSKVDDPSKNVWKWNAVVDGNEIADGPGVDDKGRPIPAVIANGTVEFDSDGNPVNHFSTRDGQPSFIDGVGKSDAMEVKFANGPKPQKLQFNFGAIIDENGQLGHQASSSLAIKSATNFHSQNGSEAGYLRSLKIELNGNIKAVYTNGLEKRLGAVALASFANNQGLQKMGRNLYMATPKAGEPRVGLGQTGSRGSIYSASLEESNVDLAQQFVDMITTQRGFQANSKSITTTDTMMEEVINLKR